MVRIGRPPRCSTSRSASARVIVSSAPDNGLTSQATRGRCALRHDPDAVPEQRIDDCLAAWPLEELDNLASGGGADLGSGGELCLGRTPDRPERTESFCEPPGGGRAHIGNAQCKQESRQIHMPRAIHGRGQSRGGHCAEPRQPPQVIVGDGEQISNRAHQRMVDEESDGARSQAIDVERLS
jgi:hypothetical protein